MSVYMVCYFSLLSPRLWQPWINYLVALFISKALHPIALNTKILVITLPLAENLSLSELSYSLFLWSAGTSIQDSMVLLYGNQEEVMGEALVCSPETWFGVIRKWDGARRLLILEYRVVLQELIQNVRKNCVRQGRTPNFSLFFTEGLNDVP